MQSVVVDGTIYVGGGVTMRPGSNTHFIVTVYKTRSGKWIKLPLCKTYDFAMVVVNRELVVVGGTGRDNHKSKIVSVWAHDATKWTSPYPDMPTGRSRCTAVGYKQWLLVAGGNGEDGRRLSSVEVINTDTKQWYAAPPTPTAWSSMKTATAGDVCYFMGGYIEGSPTNNVYSVSLPTLVSQLEAAKNARPLWKMTSKLPVQLSCPLSVRDSLFAVGGQDKSQLVATKTIYRFRPDTEEWKKVGELPSPRWNCTCATISDRELIVAGGYGFEMDLKTVDTAMI